MAIRILLADDHKIMRQGLRSLLEKEQDFEIIAEAANGEEALEIACRLRPNVVIMDVAMPILNGIQCTHRIRESAPDVKIVALTIHKDKNYLTGMLQAGTSGYLLKDCAAEELVHAVRVAANGKAYVSPEVAPLIIQDYKDFGRPDMKTDASAELTLKEREVLQMIAEGTSTKEIASRLQQSPKTVDRARAQIMRKLHVFTVAELTKYAIRNGLTSLD